MAMWPQFAALEDRVNELTLRERIITFLAMAAVLFGIWNYGFLSVQEKQQKGLYSKSKEVRTKIAGLDKELVKVMTDYSTDPDNDEQEQLNELERKLVKADERIENMISGMIEPEHMAQIIESVLKKQHGLMFVSLEHLGSEALFDTVELGADADIAATAPGIYRHTMRIKLEGGYAQTVAYLQELEMLPWQFQWDEVQLEMQSYPRASVVITVHTMSLQKGWVGV